MPDKLDNPQLQHIINHCPVGMLMQDEQGRISWINDTLAGLLGQSRHDQLLNKRADEVPEPLSALFNLSSTLHIPGNNPDEDLWLMGHHHPMPDNTGAIQYLIDITPLHWLMQERDQLKSELNDVIMVDKETGLRNRKGLYYSLEPQLSRSRRYNRPLSVIIMRLDCLDAFKQQYQRDDAQPLLASIGELLIDQLRWADIVGRLNETDFLLVLPEIHAEDANKVAENVRQQLAGLSIANVPAGDFEISARFGVAEWRKGDDMGLLLMRARQMLDGGASSQPAASG